MSFTHFRLETDAEGIALVTWDSPGRSMNVLDAQVVEELGRIVEQIAGDAAIKGAVVTSGKEGFSGGADLTMLSGMGKQYAEIARAQGEEAAMKVFFESSRQLSLTYRKLETCGKPVAAAINGVAMGGGFEFALACHYRVLADHEKARDREPEPGLLTSRLRVLSLVGFGVRHDDRGAVEELDGPACKQPLRVGLVMNRLA